MIVRVGVVAYQLDLPPELVSVHNVFHISMLHKYLSNPSHDITLEPLEFQEDLTYIEHLARVLDRKEQVLRTNVIPLVMVLWRNHSVEEVTWEREDQIRERYPHLFNFYVT